MEEAKLGIVGLVKKQVGYFIKTSEGREQPLNPETLDSDAFGHVMCSLKGQEAPVVFDEDAKEKLVRFSKTREGYCGLVVKGLFYPFMVAEPVERTKATKVTRTTKRKKVKQKIQRRHHGTAALRHRRQRPKRK